MFRAGERNHREAVRKWSEMLLKFVRRTARGDEMNFVEIEAAIGGACYDEVAIVDWIERAAKERDTAGMMLGGSAVRLDGGQLGSVDCN